MKLVLTMKISLTLIKWWPFISPNFNLTNFISPNFNSTRRISIRLGIWLGLGLGSGIGIGIGLGDRVRIKIRRIEIRWNEIRRVETEPIKHLQKDCETSAACWEETSHSCESYHEQDTALLRTTTWQIHTTAFMSYYHTVHTTLRKNAVEYYRIVVVFSSIL